MLPADGVSCAGVGPRSSKVDAPSWGSSIASEYCARLPYPPDHPERRRLKRLAYSHTAGYQQVIRARTIRDAARGYSNNTIACRQGVTVDTVRHWRNRYADEGLADRHRSGRTPRFTPTQVAEVKALACQLPAETGTPLSKWSCLELANEAIGRGIATSITASTVRRIPGLGHDQTLAAPVMDLHL